MPLYSPTVPLPFPYHSPTIPLPFPYHSPTVPIQRDANTDMGPVGAMEPSATIRRPYGAPIPHPTFPVGLRPRLLSVAPTGLLYHTAPSPWAYAHGYFPSPLRGSHTTPHLPRGLAPSATFHRPYGAPIPHRTFPVGLRPRLLSVAPTGLLYHTAPSPWACALGYFPSPLRGSHTAPHPPRGLVPTATFRRPYGAPIPQRSFPVGLRPRLLSLAPTGLPTVSPTLKTHKP